MKLHVMKQQERIGYTTWGCMWEKGRCGKETAFALTSGGRRVPVQSRVTAWWPDGSVKWTAHTANAALLEDEIEVTPADGTALKEAAASAAEPLPAADGKATDVPSGKDGTAARLCVTERGAALEVSAGRLCAVIPGDGRHLFSEIEWNGRRVLADGELELLLEEPAVIDGCSARLTRHYVSRITETAVEEDGPLQAVIRFTGCHADEKGNTRFPFVVRMRIGLEDAQLRFTHTFLYDGDEDRDFLKGIGLSCSVPMSGPVYDRHVKFMTDHGTFHESAVQLISWIPRAPERLYRAQREGRRVEPDEEESAALAEILSRIPMWDEYRLAQTDEHSFSIRKKLRDDNCCLLDCLHGVRTEGGAAVGSRAGSVLFSIRDFWEKYPSGYTVSGLTQDTARVQLWFWAPEAPAMDFRHYANRGYNKSCYEGYDYKGATPYGVACTSECAVAFREELIPSDAALAAFAESVDEPPLYVGDPEYYHGLRAFGYWSLPARDNEVERWLEEQLDRAVDFYEKEVEQRGWYGMFNYGDFMHTYDPFRHQWRYDVGGYAWDNTELVPTLWLWYAFLRTGRADIFRLAERLSRHASEVDVYHMGKYKGLGSRHNVRHWGCPCKEARIAMACHHRFYYFLTGDRRMEDIFAELKDNELTFLNKDPLGDFYDKKDMVFPSHARSGPDWSSLCANWMTWWEMTGDTAYRDKILVGSETIRQAPLRLISGPDFEFDPQTVRLRYTGERTTGGTHLQICMGAPSVWAEMADLLEDEDWKQMLADYGRFYLLSPEEKEKETNGLLGKRQFSYPFMAAGIAAYGAAHLHSSELAEKTWCVLLGALAAETEHEGFAVHPVPDAGNRKELEEIAWISTNFVSQWCLNAIIALDFIRDALPSDWQQAGELLKKAPEEWLRKA